MNAPVTTATTTTATAPIDLQPPQAFTAKCA